MTTPAEWGLQVDYIDALGAPHTAPARSVNAVLAQLARGGDPHGPAPTRGPEICFARPGDAPLPAPCRNGQLTLEDGSDLGAIDAQGQNPGGLPLGYHRVTHADGGQTTLVVSPEACHVPSDLRAWGWAVQLYSARSAHSWGIGDLHDAQAIGRSMTDVGGSPMLLVNPLHAINPGPHPQDSPYFAGSRCFNNPLYLAIDEVAGIGATADELQPLRQLAQALNDQPLLDRPTAWALKRDALRIVWDAASDQTHAHVADALAADPVLAAFAAYGVACEIRGEPWTSWPASLRHPSGSGWAAIHTGMAHRVRFHAWLQLLMREQLTATNAVVPLLHDLAIGTDRNGFDAFYWQDQFVLDGTRVGAPPDEFNTLGQDWGLPPIDPWRLRAARYEPFIRMLRANLAGGAGLRIDHVMGLFRLYWIPDGEGPEAGVYVRQPADELLDLVALESVRAGALVVGEDLGTVEPGVRDVLASRRLLSYKVMTLGDEAPDTFPTASLATATTHDLPTVPGFWTGADLAAQQRLDLAPNVDGTNEARTRLAGWLKLPLDAPVDSVVTSVYQTLAATDSVIALATLEDVAGVVDRPNMPGTIDQWPNWRQGLPQPVDAILATPLAQQVAASLASR